MTTCPECSRRRAYMAADPEMYRGDDTRCDAHRPPLRNQGDSPVTALAPCPLCGQNAAIRLLTAWGSAQAECRSCGANTGHCTDPHDAIAAWNRRAPALRWRREPPDVPGWWWSRFGDDRRLYVVHVLDPSAYLTPGMVAHAKSHGIEWAGPIPAPEEGE